MNTNHKKELLNTIKSQVQKGEESLDAFLESLLTPSEYEQIVKRLQIIKQLKLGIPHRDIASNLEVGIATITRGSRELSKGNFNHVA